MLHRRHFLAASAAAAVTLQAPFVRAQSTTTIRMGALKLIHSIAPHFYEKFTPDGYKVEVVPFESPTEGKNAVVTKSVDFGMFGIAAALLGAAANEPIVVIASACNKGMAVVAGKDSPVASIKDLKGKRVAIWPGSTQEVFILERLRMEGMSIKDITPVRISFSEMHLALARGDVDAYVGAEPGPGVSLASGIGKIVEYPYGTAMGSLNMVFGAHRETLAQKPDITKVILGIHRKASDFAMANRAEMVAMAVSKLGQKKEAIEQSAPNVDLTWKFGDTEIGQAKTYAQHMLELKQIKQLPDFAAFFDTRFVDEIARQA
ncbi:putative aliphatic sulfonates-binding protein precursor [Variibacter gotjawalensis]|uniref:Putative aliphatic sulfonates-binding protein n=1 Tax=Variibacter gotjawalensis TaxID=1333996 RepID=A0A0S3PT35_9BRAD|nr:NrtA/SsuA/CpmA family ABC transporter substrate-binding protein [Variibacter gotjawalensis]NIK49440.1 NitT/TauT family transport system substrate-binding protein [Variibacter gotjawalensis]RZS51292.1 NitT/TauT family transport system substrate-binding protein [Variibacter gotjawalensis]BAT59125.1 putative aliphatic sulfonates-binding protein precursor [Variibacter gotjawalensis]